jgi:pyruvate formate lyase activating enzyme
MKTPPLIASIKRHSLEDGPGIRSVVFFKGCPLRCVFCHNPEAQERQHEIAFSKRRCLACGECAGACPQSAVDSSLAARIHRDRCRVCGECARACPSGALRLVGFFCSVEELVEVLLRDLPYYRHSGGGVTLSGGEPTLYPEFVSRLLQELKGRGIHTCLETCGFFEYQTFAELLLPYLDQIYFDLKLIDPKLHAKYTGKDNHRILDNLGRLHAEADTLVEVRTPLIPGITATVENLAAVRSYLLALGIRRLVLLPYNPLGVGTAERLGRPRAELPDRFMSRTEEEQTAAFLRGPRAQAHGREIQGLTDPIV